VKLIFKLRNFCLLTPAAGAFALELCDQLQFAFSAIPGQNGFGHGRQRRRRRRWGRRRRGRLRRLVMRLSRGWTWSGRITALAWIRRIEDFHYLFRTGFKLKVLCHLKPSNAVTV